MAITFPGTPSVNDTTTTGGYKWIYNGSGWVRMEPYPDSLTNVAWTSLYEVEHATIQAVGDGGTLPNTWPDTMGTHDLTNTATITRTLDLVDADFNNHSSVDFSTGAGHWRKTGLSIAQPYSVVYLWHPMNQAAVQTHFGLNDTANTRGVGQGNTGSGRAVRMDAGTNIDNEPVPVLADNLTFLMEYHFNGANSYCLVNGAIMPGITTETIYGFAPGTTGRNPGTGSIGQFVLGAGTASGTIGLAATCKLSWVGVYEGDHRDDPWWMPTARYIAEHWAVNCSYNPAHPTAVW